MKNQEIIKHIGQQIRHQRQKNGMTQKVLGEKLGVMPATVSAWELGKISPQIVTVIQIEDIFNCNIDCRKEEHLCKQN